MASVSTCAGALPYCDGAISLYLERVLASRSRSTGCERLEFFVCTLAGALGLNLVSGRTFVGLTAVWPLLDRWLGFCILTRIADLIHSNYWTTYFYRLYV